ncbi:MAG: hypothetical protein LBH95_07935 [Oscillospiraceae bacterium]|nr:hypothetical protein [Oscillospiraceae bacterium]
MKFFLTAGIILVSIVSAVAGWIILPDTLVLQVTMSGDAGTTLPKAAGLGIPFLLSVIFAVLYCLRENKKHLLVSVIGLAVYALVFLMN